MTATTTPLTEELVEPVAVSASEPPPSNESERHLAHAVELLRELDTLMLLSFERYETNGQHQEPKFHARPMGIAAVDDDGTVWMVTSIDSTKVDEALTPNDGYAVAQTKTRQVSIRGTFTVVRDPDQIAAVWKKSYEVWFPAGPKDPRVCLLGLHPREIEFWDASGANGLKYLVDAARAFMSGEPPKPRPEEHERLHIA